MHDMQIVYAIRILHLIIWVKILLDNNYQIGTYNQFFHFEFLFQYISLTMPVHICNLQGMFRTFMWRELCLKVVILVLVSILSKKNGNIFDILSRLCF